MPARVLRFRSQRLNVEANEVLQYGKGFLRTMTYYLVIHVSEELLKRPSLRNGPRILELAICVETLPKLNKQGIQVSVAISQVESLREEGRVNRRMLSSVARAVRS
jgi:hypothetical protein